MKKKVKIQSAKSDLILYETADGRTKVEVRLQDETVWLTQKLMAELFQTTPQKISPSTCETSSTKGSWARQQLVRIFYKFKPRESGYRISCPEFSDNCYRRREDSRKRGRKK